MWSSSLTWGVTLQNPPALVKLVMEAVCIMKGVKPDRKPDPSGVGKMIEEYWGPSLKMLGDFKFLDSLRDYDKDSIPPAIIKRIREKWVYPGAHVLLNPLLCTHMHAFSIYTTTSTSAHQILYQS